MPRIGQGVVKHAFFFILVDHHGGAVRQLIAGQAEQLFADQLGGHELVAAVGERVFVVNPGLLRQVGFDDLEQPLHIAGLGGRHRHVLGKSVALLHRFEPGHHVGAAGDGIELVGHQKRRFVGRQQRQHLGIVEAELASLDQEPHHVHIAQGGGDGAVQVAVQGGAAAHLFGLEAGRVDKYKLRSAQGADAGDAVAGGLRFARGDADLLPDQRIEQGGLAHIGPADDGDGAAALAERVGAGVGLHRPLMIFGAVRRGVGIGHGQIGLVGLCRLLRCGHLR